MVSYPNFDPNLFFAQGANEAFTRLSLDPSFPFLNRAIQSAYPPAREPTSRKPPRPKRYCSSSMLQTMPGIGSGA